MDRAGFERYKRKHTEPMSRKAFDFWLRKGGKDAAWF